MGGDLGAAAMDAGNLQAAFAKVEGFWTKKGGADDAVMFAKNIQAAAAATKRPQRRGDKDGDSCRRQDGCSQLRGVPHGAPDAHGLRLRPSLEARRLPNRSGARTKTRVPTKMGPPAH